MPELMVYHYWNGFIPERFTIMDKVFRQNGLPFWEKGFMPYLMVYYNLNGFMPERLSNKQPLPLKQRI